MFGWRVSFTLTFPASLEGYGSACSTVARVKWPLCRDSGLKACQQNMNMQMHTVSAFPSPNLHSHQNNLLPQHGDTLANINKATNQLIALQRERAGEREGSLLFCQCTSYASYYSIPQHTHTHTTHTTHTHKHQHKSRLHCSPIGAEMRRNETTEREMICFFPQKNLSRCFCTLWAADQWFCTDFQPDTTTEHQDDSSPRVCFISNMQNTITHTISWES